MPDYLNFINHKTQESSTLNLLIDLNRISQNDFEDLEKILNQPEIYKLFGKALDGKRIDKDRIKSILDFYIKGFEEKDCFLYLIRNSQERIVGAIDLQRQGDKSFSIGFWANNRKKGFISGALNKLKDVLNKEKIKNLDSYIEPENEDAKRVLERNGFEFVEETIGKSGKRLLKYFIKL